MYVLPGNAKFPEAYPTRAYGCADGEGSTGGASGHKAWREVRGGGARASRTSFIFSFLKDLLLGGNGGRDLCFVWGGGGSNRCDAGLDLSGSWQQGHSATYNAPSRI